MNWPSTPPDPDALREDFLCLTSDLRLGLDRVQVEPSSMEAVRHILTIGGAITAMASHTDAPQLVRCSELIERMATLGRAQLSARPGDSAAIFADMFDAVGYLEQLIEGWLDGWDSERQDDLDLTLSALFPRDVPLSQTAGPILPVDDALPIPQPEQPLAAVTLDADPEIDTGTPQSEIDDTEVDPELLEVFGAEADEILATCEDLLLKLDSQARNRDVLYALFRQFHTLKGAAAAVGLEAAAAYVHEGESLLEAAASGDLAVDGQVLVDFLFRLVDSVAGLVNRARGIHSRQRRIIPNIEQEIGRLLHTGSPAPAGGEAPSPHVPPSSSAVQCSTSDTQGKSSRLTDIDKAVSAPPRHGFDPEERPLSPRRLAQKLDPEDSTAEATLGTTPPRPNAADIPKLLAGGPQPAASLRMVPFESIFRRLLRSVRDVARQEGKFAELQLHGNNVLADRTVVEGLYAPLLHLVRNAVSHGIEPPTEREAAGKSRTGIVRVAAESVPDGSTIVTVADDGAGLDFTAILEKARAKHLIAPTAQPPREELLQLIFQLGFSTKTAVTQVAGRGVGMDVVAHEIAALNGRVTIDSQPRLGTTILLHLPAPAATASAALNHRPPHAARAAGGARTDAA